MTGYGCRIKSFRMKEGGAEIRIFEGGSIAGKPVQSTIDCLETFLMWAKEGIITSVAIAALRPDHFVKSIFYVADQDNPLLLIGGMEWLKDLILNEESVIVDDLPPAAA